MKVWNTIQNPEIFQGNMRKNHYFEGWYFKVVSADKKHVFAFIPGIAINKKKNSSHSFLQVFDGLNNKYFYMKYPLKEFKASKQMFKISINKNFFSEKYFKININKSNLTVKGSFKNTDLTPLPKSILSPGAMGILSYIPFLQTYHGIVSMDHKIYGTLNYNNETIEFKEGSKGYIEKDWGNSFPSSWIWMQTNHFREKKVSLMCSIAVIPLLKKELLGILCIFSYNNRIYKFTTYTGAKLRILKTKEKQALIVIEEGNHILKIVAKQGETTEMKAPDLGDMSSHDQESLDSEIVVRFYKKRKKRFDLIFQGLGVRAGLEIMNPRNLMAKWRK